MNNEEPIEYSHYPGGQPPTVNDVPAIERDYFPAPPFPFTDPGKVYFSLLLNMFSLYIIMWMLQVYKYILYSLNLFSLLLLIDYQINKV